MPSPPLKSAQHILDFWFSDAAKKRWFSSTDAFDATIRLEFETTAMHLVADYRTGGAARHWEEQGADAHLALILALDQFPRNMYRATPAAFAWDSRALAVAKRMVDRKRDIALTQEQRPFAYMPFMHSENLEDQERCIALCDARLDDENTLKFAMIHRDVIARFGRFPHRNEILGRDTTPEEQRFLDEGGFSA